MSGGRTEEAYCRAARLSRVFTRRLVEHFVDGLVGSRQETEAPVKVNSQHSKALIS